MKKIIVVALATLMGIILCSCDLFKQVQSVIIEQAVLEITKEAGIENFMLPASEGYTSDFSYNEETDKLTLVIIIENPEGDFEEYKDQITQYINESIDDNNDDQEHVVVPVVPLPVSDGYYWTFIHTTATSEEVQEEITFSIRFTQNGNHWYLAFELIGAGNVLESISSDLEN